MKVTLENLKAKNACRDGYKFGEECLAAGLDPVQECANRQIEWFQWLAAMGFDCESARRDGFTWDESGRVTATAGHGGTATAGHGGTATAGDWGTATAGNGGTATAGDWGTATAGHGGTATAGDWGVVSILYWDRTKHRRRCAEVGEGGLKPNTPYKLNEAGEFIEVEVPA
jgi:hypothetical protein